MLTIKHIIVSYFIIRHLVVKLSMEEQIILNERNSYVTEFLKNFF